MTSPRKQKVLWSSVAVAFTLGTFFVYRSHSIGLARKPASGDTSCDYQYFDRANLLSLGQAGTVTNIADIIKGAPDCFKQNQVAVYNSESLHCANFRAPRMILYANDDDFGRTVCSFNSGIKADYPEFYQKDPKVDCHESSMECETFNVASNRFEFYEIKEGNKNISVSNVNPTQCLLCHKGTEDYLGSKNPRPNIENYPAWPGFYGSMHDKFGATPKELDAYLHQFLVYKPSNARYSLLPTVLGSDGRYTGSNGKPIVNLQNRLSNQNQQHIGSEFTEQPTLARIWPYRYALLGALACDDDLQFRDPTKDDNSLLPAARNYRVQSFLPDVLNQTSKTNFDTLAIATMQQHLDNLKKLYTNQQKLGDITFDQFLDQYKTDIANDAKRSYPNYDLADSDDYWNMVRLAYLASNLGIPIQNWSMTFGSSLDFEAGDANPKQIIIRVAPFFLDPVVDADVKFPDFITSLGEIPDTHLCTTLRNKSLKALSGVTQWPTSGGVIQPVPNNGPPQALTSCIGCHVMGLAPKIPFNDSTQLKQAFSAMSVTDPGKTLFEEISKRLDEGSMPPNAELGAGEKESLKAYFNQLQGSSNR
jgi:hypothetical protein